MYARALLVLGVALAVVLAEGQYYVPRAYYTIDAEGHASAPVPLRRLKRHLLPIANAFPHAYGFDNSQRGGAWTPHVAGFHYPGFGSYHN